MADAKTHFEQGQEYRKQGKLDEAIAEFKEAIQLNPLYTEAHREYIDMMLERGEKAEILVEYQVKVQQHPDSEVHHYLLGRVLDNIDDKLREFKEAIEINPNYPWGHYGLGWAYRSKEMLDLAIAEYKEAIKINPDFAEAHYNLGMAYKDQGKLDYAIKEYQEAIRIKPDYACAHCRLGTTYRSKGELDLAIAAYKKSIEKKPDCAEAHCKLGHAYGDKRMLDNAIAAYKEAICLDPDDVEAHHFLGHAYFDKNMFDEAIAEWKITIKLTPDDARLYKDLRNAYFKAGKLDELIEETEQRLETDASDARGHYLLALALTEKWEAERAIENFRKAIELDPSYEAAHDDYIDLMKKRGRHAEVRTEYKEKAEAQPDNELWRKLLERLPAIRKRLISPVCALCIGRGVFNLAYLQFILLVGISGAIASFARELIPFSSYLALAIYVAIISAIHAPFDTMFLINKLKKGISKIRAIDLGLVPKLISSTIGGLVGLLEFVPIAILTYAAMQIFHANWWIPIAALGVLYSIVTDELKALMHTRKLKPLEDQILVERLTRLIERGNLKIKNILRIDTDRPLGVVMGILLPKRICMSNSMLQRLSVPEIEAVFAHELGHVKAGSMQKQFFVQSALIFVRLYLANLIYGILLPVYGFSGPEQIAALPLLAFCWLILGLPVRAIQSSVSQYFERKADQYAISEVGESLFSSAFDKILETRQGQILSPIFNFVCYAHPCREERMHTSRHKRI